MTLDDVTSVAIHVRHEARSLHESPSKDYVLVSNCCYGSGRDNTAGRTTVVRSGLTKSMGQMILIVWQDVR